MPYMTFRVGLKGLIASMVKLTIRTDAKRAASTLHRFLMDGENCKLRAHDITPLYGLELEGCLEIGNGAFLAPWDEVQEMFGLQEDEESEIEDRGRSRFPTSFLRANAAFVRELTWGPAVWSTENGESEVPKTEYRFPVDYQSDNSSRDLNRGEFLFSSGHETVRDLLSIAIARHLVTRHQFICVERWLEDIDPNYKQQWTSGSWWINDWWHENSLSDESAAKFMEMLCGYQSCTGNRRQLDLAIWRLAASNSRIGRFGTEDRIIDTAIALEILYGLDGTEITHKLKTRAAFFLGEDAKERIEISRKVSRLYEVRSNAVHGETKRKKRLSLEERAQALDDGFHIARETLIKLLREKSTPDWNTIVFTGGETLERQSKLCYQLRKRFR